MYNMYFDLSSAFKSPSFSWYQLPEAHLKAVQNGRPPEIESPHISQSFFKAFLAIHSVCLIASSQDDKPGWESCWPTIFSQQRHLPRASCCTVVNWFTYGFRGKRNCISSKKKHRWPGRKNSKNSMHQTRLDFRLFLEATRNSPYHKYLFIADVHSFNLCTTPPAHIFVGKKNKETPICVFSLRPNWLSSDSPAETGTSITVHMASSSSNLHSPPKLHRISSLYCPTMKGDPRDQQWTIGRAPHFGRCKILLHIFGSFRISVTLPQLEAVLSTAKRPGDPISSNRLVG